MNYQIFPFIFTRTAMLFLFVFAVVLTFFNLSALLTYLILVGLFFPIGISMRLHQLNETGVALTLTEKTHNITYIHGLPAHEQRVVIKNPCFWSKKRIQQFYIFSFLGKLILQGFCIAILAREYLLTGANAATDIVALLILVYMLSMSGRSAYMLYRIATHRWRCEPLTTSSGSVWYQGFLFEGNNRVTLFERLL
ncbi:TPA: hypothetical protein ACIJWR_002400 [Citrobacter sedlakii]